MRVSKQSTRCISLGFAVLAVGLITFAIWRTVAFWSVDPLECSEPSTLEPEYLAAFERDWQAHTSEGEKIDPAEAREARAAYEASFTRLLRDDAARQEATMHSEKSLIVRSCLCGISFLVAALALLLGSMVCTTKGRKLSGSHK
jgi:hypothetical protein